MRILGVNGIRTHGAGNIDRLLLEMRIRGFDTVDVHLPKRNWWNVRRYADDYKILVQLSEDGDIVVGHSRGCLLIGDAHREIEYKAIVCIAPAMDDKFEWRYPERVHCFYSPDDWAVRIGSWLRFQHPFGPAGNRGFAQPEVHDNLVKGAGHNDFFFGELVQHIADYNADLARG